MKRPTPPIRRTSSFPLFPLLAALLLILLAAQGLRMLAELNTITPETTPKLTTTSSPFENINRIHPKAAGSIPNLRPVAVLAPAFSHNIRTGNPTTNHTLTIFTDPLCTACRTQLLQTLPKDTSNLAITYKYWPQNPTNVMGGLILQLAHTQGHGDTLLTAISGIETTLTDLNLLTLLETAGTNLSTQRKLMADQGETLTNAINRDISQATDLNLGPPPQLILDGYLLDGRILQPERLQLYLSRLHQGQNLIQTQDYWLNTGE